MIIIIICIIIICIIIIFISQYILSYENYINNNNNIYLTKTELENELIKDNDNYYTMFNMTDLKVRNISDIDSYMILIKKSCIDINDTNKSILNKCIDEANKKLSKYSTIGFDGSKCAMIQWKIGLIDGNMYESGLPHTRNDIIILPIKLLNITFGANQLVNTLIHEKIHVYQKLYKSDIDLYLQENGFTKYIEKKDMNNCRANPDMDNWIYKNKDGDIMKSLYNNNASYISDVTIYPVNSYMYEHPFEWMAYNITNNLN